MTSPEVSLVQIDKNSRQDLQVTNAGIVQSSVDDILHFLLTEVDVKIWLFWCVNTQVKSHPKQVFTPNWPT